MKPGAVWSKDMARLYITSETKEQVDSRTDECIWIKDIYISGGTVGVFAVGEVCRYRFRRSVVPDRIEDRAKGDLEISLSNLGPRTKKGE